MCNTHVDKAQVLGVGGRWHRSCPVRSGYVVTPVIHNDRCPRLQPTFLFCAEMQKTLLKSLVCFNLVSERYVHFYVIIESVHYIWSRGV